MLSAGSEPAHQVNPIGVQAMHEEGIDITAERPNTLPTKRSKYPTLSVVITMGCGNVCPFYPGERYEDWDLDDPAGQDIETVRRIRDEIKKRVESLIDDLLE